MSQAIEVNFICEKTVYPSTQIQYQITVLCSSTMFCSVSYAVIRDLNLFT